MRRRDVTRALLAGLVSTIGVVAGAGIAGAHISIDPTTAEQGTVAVLRFRVPNERTDADTVKVRVQLPPEVPLAYVAPREVPGWTITLEKATPAGSSVARVSVITWEGGTIAPERYQDFDVALGPLPTTTATATVAFNTLAFPAIQTYSDGQNVDWIERVDAGTPKTDLEHPAPVLLLVAPGSGDAGGSGPALDEHGDPLAGPGAGAGSTSKPLVGATPASAASPVATAGSDTSALAGAALGASIVAMIAACAALALALRSRKP